MKSNQKYQIGNSVIITRGQYKGNRGKIVGIADFRLYNRLTYCVKGDHFESAFVSYELAPAPEIIKDAVKPEKMTKVVVEFDIDEKHPLKLNNKVYERATKVKINDKVVRNRYGTCNVIEKQLSLTLEEAQQMYNAGGELRKLALRIYTEDELHPVPCTWEEYCENAYGKFYFINSGQIYDCTIIGGLDTVSGADLLPSYELTKAVLTFEKLLILRNAWIKNWTPDWSDEKQEKYYLKWCFKNVSVFPHTYTDGANEVMSFPTIEMARKFKDCFGGFLETAKNLY